MNKKNSNLLVLETLKDSSDFSNMGLDTDFLKEKLPDLDRILAEVAKEQRPDPIKHLIQLLQKKIELRNDKN